MGYPNRGIPYFGAVGKAHTASPQQDTGTKKADTHLGICFLCSYQMKSSKRDITTSAPPTANST